MNLRTVLLATACLITSTAMAGTAMAAGGSGYPLDHAPIDAGNTSSLQRGAKLFANYCMGCHAASYSRYNRVARDLGIPDDLMRENLIFTTDKGERTKVGSLMRINMTTDYAKEAFGVVPPDLSLIARSRGSDWLYTFLRTFYVDESRPLGANNALFPGVGMPHVLWELEGLKSADLTKNDQGQDVVTGFTSISEGSQSKAEYDKSVGDLVNFLAYLAEPYAADRQRIGILILLFLFVFAGVAYYAKKEYWSDVS